MRSKFWALLLSIMMVVTMMPASAFAGNGGGNGGGSGSASGTADHIDIGMQLSAKLTIGEETINQTVSLTEADIKSDSFTITAEQNGTAYTGFTVNKNNITTSEGQSGIKQYRISGSYPVGTKDNPVYYTVTLSKTVVFKSEAGEEYSVPMQFTATFSYWDPDNDCPGIQKRDADGSPSSFSNNAGLDFTLGSGAKSKGVVSIQKSVVDNNGETLAAENKSYTFNIYQENDSENPVDTVVINPGNAGIGIGSTNLDYGTYTISEVVPEGDSINGYNYSSTIIKINGTETNSFTLDKEKKEVSVTAVNVYAPEKPETINVSVKKEWADNNNQDGIRPDEVEVQLLAEGEEYGDTVFLNDDNNWSYTFTNLPKYIDGDIVTYTVTEVDLSEKYIPSIELSEDRSTIIITNTHEPETIDVKGYKIWKDANNQDGLRPTTVVLGLYANDGEEPVAKQTVSGDGDKWEYVFTGLPKYENGSEIKYTVKEESVISGYDVSYDGTNVINTHEPAKTSVSGSKSWKDNGNQDGKRPKAITINLLANGNRTDITKTVTAEDEWQWTFTGLDKFSNGEEIVYTFEEVAVDDYSTTYSEDGKTVINSYTPEQTSVSVSKTWVDDYDRDGIRPDSVTVELYADGEPTGKTEKLSEDNQWITSFTGLDKYRDGGIEIGYTIVEEEVSGYTADITGDATNGFIVTNTHEAEKTSVSGSKEWDDSDNQDGIRPEAITVNLLANGQEIRQAVVTEEDNWSWNFDNLYKNENGDEIEYTITEDEIAGYTTEINGYDITNSHAVESTGFTITKNWEGDKESDRPDSITVNILADGEVCETVELTEADGWAYEVIDMVKYREGEVGEAVEYTVEEETVDGYKAKIVGFDITNIKKDNGGTETKTGDDFNPWIFAGLAFIALLAVLAVIFTRRQRQR
ncbi:MAG: Cna B-type domain-containing protein [Lentihominibacter sp.]